MYQKNVKILFSLLIICAVHAYVVSSDKQHELKEQQWLLAYKAIPEQQQEIDSKVLRAYGYDQLVGKLGSLSVVYAADYSDIEMSSSKKMNSFKKLFDVLKTARYVYPIDGDRIDISQKAHPYAWLNLPSRLGLLALAAQQVSQQLSGSESGSSLAMLAAATLAYLPYRSSMHDYQNRFQLHVIRGKYYLVDTKIALFPFRCVEPGITKPCCIDMYTLCLKEASHLCQKIITDVSSQE